MFTEVSLLIRKENLLGDTERKCLEKRENEECLNQQNNMCVTKRQFERIAGYQNLS